MCVVRTEDEERYSDVKMPEKTVLSELLDETEETVIVATADEVT